MWFDAKAALAKIEREAGHPATLATSATSVVEKVPQVAKVAEVAAADPPKRKSAEIIILEAIRTGNHRHGPVAKAAGIGATKVYQEIDRMLRAGLIAQAIDGKLSELQSEDE